MPVLNARRTPHYVTRMDFKDRSAPLLDPSHAVQNDQVLTGRM